MTARGPLAMSRKSFGCRNWGRGMLLALSGQKPGMLLKHSTIYRTVTTTNNDPSPNSNPNIIKAGFFFLFFKATVHSTYLNNKYLLNTQ